MNLDAPIEEETNEKLKDDSAGYTPIRSDECHTLRSPSFNVTGVISPTISPKVSVLGYLQKK